MTREIITIEIGQAGIQIGNALWELYCLEHGVSVDGRIRDSGVEDSNCIDSLFYETKDKRYIPRTIFMDLEPTCIDEIRSGSYKSLFNPGCLLSGMEDAASNYARGFFNLGKQHIGSLLATIRKMVINCDNFSLFEIINSYSGGTGSGFTSLLLEKLNDEYSKKYRFETGIFPSKTFSESTVGPYNALLYTHTTFDNLDCGILIDNESLYDKLCRLLLCSKPTFTIINRFLSQMLSCIFMSHRYQYSGSQHMDVDELMTNSVPYPRIHFPVLAYAPLVNIAQVNHERTQPEELTRQIFQTNSHFLNCPIQLSKYISCCLLYRGQISPKEVYDAIALVKSDYRIQFVDWCPTGFKIGINYQPSMSAPHNVLATCGETLCMLSGNIGIRTAWYNLRRKYHCLVSKRSFIHWFIGEGLEENDFIEANEDIQVLENDYAEIGRDTIENEEMQVDAVKSSTLSSFKDKDKSTVSNSLMKDQKNTSAVKEKRRRIRQNSVSDIKSNSYCKMLYEDIVTKLDSKIQCSNRRLLKKLEKLKSKLNHMNQIYNNAQYDDKFDNLSNNFQRSRSTTRTVIDNEYNKDSSSFGSEAEVDNYRVVKQIIRKRSLNNLALSSREEIFCSPNIDFSNNCPRYNSSSKSSTPITSKVTSESSLNTED